MPFQNRMQIDERAAQSDPLHALFRQLTPKQHEVLRHISENRTSKEIAWELGISESAVNQRIEGVRNRAGSPPRAHLARAYRQFLKNMGADSNTVPAHLLQVPGSNHQAPSVPKDAPSDGVVPADGQIDSAAHGLEGEPGRIAPKLLDGENAGGSRVTAMIVIALGILLVVMLGLVAARLLTNLV